MIGPVPKDYKSPMWGDYYKEWSLDPVRWVVHVIDSHKDGGEISVIRSNNHHGFRSYGWPHPQEKIILLSTNGPYPKKLWNMMIRAGRGLAKEMNK